MQKMYTIFFKKFLEHSEVNMFTSNMHKYLEHIKTQNWKIVSNLTYFW